MLIAGAGGHAIEILHELETYQSKIAFFDDVFEYSNPFKFNKFPIIQTEAGLIDFFKKDARFCLGVGKPQARYLLKKKLSNMGGQLTSVISSKANIGKWEITLGNGLNIMSGAVLTISIMLGEGTLIHVNSSIHHNCEIGNYCEISPGARILGHVQLGSFVSIGSNAVVLPKVSIGNNVVVGAGSVVTKNIPDNSLVMGVPGKIISHIPDLDFL